MVSEDDSVWKVLRDRPLARSELDVSIGLTLGNFFGTLLQGKYVLLGVEVWTTNRRYQHWS